MFGLYFLAKPTNPMSVTVCKACSRLLHVPPPPPLRTPSVPLPLVPHSPPHLRPPFPTCCVPFAPLLRHPPLLLAPREIFPLPPWSIAAPPSSVAPTPSPTPYVTSCPPPPPCISPPSHPSCSLTLLPSLNPPPPGISHLPDIFVEDPVRVALLSSSIATCGAFSRGPARSRFYTSYPCPLFIFPVNDRHGLPHISFRSSLPRRILG